MDHKKIETAVERPVATEAEAPLLLRGLKGAAVAVKSGIKAGERQQKYGGG